MSDNDNTAVYESVFRSYVQCINQGRWKDLPDVVAFPVTVNGERIAMPEDFAAASTAQGRVKLRTDAFTVDSATGRLGVTSLVELRPAGSPERTVRYAKQSLVWLGEEEEGGGGRRRRIVEMACTGAPAQEVERQLAWPGYVYAPDLIGAYSAGHYRSARPRASAAALERAYRDYVACINARTMQSRLPAYCQPHVIHNARRLSLDEYRLLIQEAVTAIPDIRFDVETLVVDASAQRAAVRLQFTGTPTGTLAGVEPNGRSVHFYEYVTYFFQDGKIDRVWSIVDWDSYRKQLSQDAAQPNGNHKVSSQPPSTEKDPAFLELL